MALEVFHLQEDDFLVSAEAALARGWTDHVEQPIDHNAPEADLRSALLRPVKVQGVSPQPPRCLIIIP